MTQMVSTVRCISVLLGMLPCELSDNHIVYYDTEGNVILIVCGENSDRKCGGVTNTYCRGGRLVVVDLLS
jgi:hypothetical protein